MKEEIRGVKEFLNKGIPYFGICLGLQVMVKALGRNVKKNLIKEVGWRDPRDNISKIHVTEEGKSDPIFKGIKKEFTYFNYTVKRLNLHQKSNFWEQAPTVKTKW